MSWRQTVDEMADRIREAFPFEICHCPEYKNTPWEASADDVVLGRFPTYSSALESLDKEARSLPPPPPAWHDRPTCLGRWDWERPDDIGSIRIKDESQLKYHQNHPSIAGLRWYGPIPEDTR